MRLQGDRRPAVLRRNSRNALTRGPALSLNLRLPRLPRSPWRVATGAAAFLILTSLAGCGGGPSWLPFSHSEKTKAACPAAIIPVPLANTALFTGPSLGMRPTDVTFYGILTDINAECDVRGNALQVSLNVIVAAERGPATRGDSAQFTYFLAVVGPDDSILSKRSFGVRVNIPEHAKRGGVTDHFQETIPLNGAAPGALRIVAGFQQTPQDIDFYQHFRGR